MSRMPLHLRRIDGSMLGGEPDRIWWSERAVLANPLDVQINTSDLMPDGTVVHGVQIQAETLLDEFGLSVRITLSVVQSEFPTLAEVSEGQRVVDWRWIKINKAWYSIQNQANEWWPMRRTMHGSHMRFAVSFETENENGALVRIGVLYSPG